MLNVMKNNLEKFKFVMNNDNIHYFVYNKIKIEVIYGNLKKYYSLYYNNELIHLQGFEKFKFNILVRKLIKNKHLENKDKIIKALNV